MKFKTSEFEHVITLFGKRSRHEFEESNIPDIGLNTVQSSSKSLLRLYEISHWSM